MYNNRMKRIFYEFCAGPKNLITMTARLYFFKNLTLLSLVLCRHFDSIYRNFSALLSEKFMHY